MLKDSKEWMIEVIGENTLWKERNFFLDCSEGVFLLSWNEVGCEEVLSFFYSCFVSFILL